MAKLSFFRGAITGRLGEFVGGKWKGINYLRMYAKPSNPRTEGQISIRKVFSAVSLFATALFSKGIMDLIPLAKKMTERNSVFKANKQMFTDKTFVPSALQVCKANHPAVCSSIGIQILGDVFDFASSVSIPNNVSKVGLMANFFIYDFVKGVCCGYLGVPITFSANTFAQTVDGEIDLPIGFNTPEGSLKTDCRLYVFVTGIDENDKPLISATYSSALA